MEKRLLSAVAALSVMTAAPAAFADEHDGAMDVPKITPSVVLKELDAPWDMAFLPDGTMFFTEKCDGLSVRTTDGTVNALYGMEDSEGYADTGSDLFCEGQAGMLGVVPDRHFAENRTLYVYSTSNKYHGDGCKTNFEKCDGNIVMKFTVSEDLTSVSDRTDIVTDIQYKPFESDQPFGGPGAHNGGRIRIGPGGYLWVAGGDRHIQYRLGPKNAAVASLEKLRSAVPLAACNLAVHFEKVRDMPRAFSLFSACLRRGGAYPNLKRIVANKQRIYGEVK